MRAITDLACADHTGPAYAVTSASAAFTAADSGTLLWIAAGGHWLGGLQTIAYVNATTVTVSADPTDDDDAADGIAVIGSGANEFPVEASASVTERHAAVTVTARKSTAGGGLVG